MNNLHLVDEKSALEALCGDRQLLSELAVMFTEDVPTLLQELEDATNRQDAETACRTMHSLRGHCATFFAADVVNLALRLELEAKAENLEALRQGGIEELKSAIDNLMRELRFLGYVK